MPTIAARKNLSDDLVDLIRDMIIEGKLPAGERINEVHLAAALNVSRTPLREALSRLAAECFVKPQPRRGFFVQQLEPEQVEQLYMIRSILDPAALELAGIPTDRQLNRLERLNEKISKVSDNPTLIIDLDDQWHLELLAHCPNPILLEQIQQFMGRTRPLEYAYMRAHPNIEVAVAEHQLILQALHGKDLPSAVQALQQNMGSAVPALIEWLQQRE